MQDVVVWIWIVFAIAIAVVTDSDQQFRRVDSLISIRGIHFPLVRRDGRFLLHNYANITGLCESLHLVEAKYARSVTRQEGNKIVRHWQNGLDGADSHMLSGAGVGGGWYARIEVGDPPQTLEVDVDMLSPDFYTIMTTSERGSKYDTFGSSAHVPSSEYAHPLCRTPSDLFSLPHSSDLKTQARLKFPLCQPGKYSPHTLHNSGTILGLAPPGPTRSLSRLSKQPTFLEQLSEQALVSHSLWSLTLLTADTGVLSLGGTIAPHMEESKIRAEQQLSYLGRLSDPFAVASMEEEIKGAMAFAIPAGSTHEDHFSWSDVGQRGVEGWYMTLMTGVWVNGVKVLKNQPALLDANCPFIIAPVGAASPLYNAIPGGGSLSSLLEDRQKDGETGSFYAYPCLNEVQIEFEVAGWRFPLGKAEMREDAVHGPVGGPFSLGQVDLRSDRNDTGARVGTGYCVGIIVESKMGIKKDWERSAMRDVWVLGEPFFRGLGVAFDMGDKEGKGAKIGFRVY